MSSKPRLSFSWLSLSWIALSWRQKFTLLILVTLLGLSAITLGAWLSQKKESAVFQNMLAASAYQNATLRLLTDLKELENLSLGISEDTLIELQNSLNTLPTTAQQLNLQAAALNNDDLTQQATDIVQSVDTYVEQREKWLELRQSVGFEGEPNAQQKQDLYRESVALEATTDNLANQLEMLGTTIKFSILAEGEETIAQVKKTGLLVIIISSVSVALILVLSVIALARGLNIKLKAISGLMHQVGEGNLSQRVAVTRNKRDEFNQLSQSANAMVASMAALVEQLLNGNATLTTIQGHMGQTMTSLSHSSRQIEERIQMTAASTQEISSTLNEIAERSAQVSNLSQQAEAKATQGEAVITTNAGAIRELSTLISDSHEQVSRLQQSGTRVKGILDTINSLADQTNLLALNAAIEAARAGDAGRGFSVVADEVRSLAQKTVAATEGIGVIIQEFSQQTQAISILMDKGLTLATNGEQSAADVAGSITEIRQYITDLRADIYQVVGAVEEISTTTEEIADKMENIHDHARQQYQLGQDMQEQTRQLDAQIEVVNQATADFVLEESGYQTGQDDEAHLTAEQPYSRSREAFSTSTASHYSGRALA
ncbi:methyl-accepting chemotaxis protein [Pokkaliibacter sp. CJK22405]|uniref:methyl-accepting chemotaxis protein n=1 Tax=Pokkaliibacter sp. CJK22405 TaxID=3384615 RepID=UPI0039848975